MCPTPTGRIHTRTATIWLPALVGLIVTLVTGHTDWIVLIGISHVQGIFLDTCVYSWLFRFQPPWMTFVLAIAELGILLVFAGLLNDANGGVSRLSVGGGRCFF